jgi:hypothetical protein
MSLSQIITIQKEVEGKILKIIFLKMVRSIYLNKKDLQKIKIVYLEKLATILKEKNVAFN